MNKPIPKPIFDALSHGTREAANLAEGLAVDFTVLMMHVHPEIDFADIDLLTCCPPSITERMKRAGQILLKDFGLEHVQELIDHPSDTVRGWACYVIGLAPDVKLKQRLQLMLPLADDSHFGVREWAWMAVRSHIATDIETAIKLLTPWTKKSSPFLRRFATEATRPRGVWCTHIDRLKKEPEIALSLLEPLSADPEKYVQDSVSNWLNDAAKSQPEWVKELCKRWTAERPGDKATARIASRAQRSL